MKIEFDFEKGSASFPVAAAERVTRASDIALRLLILLASEPLYRNDFEAHAPMIAEKLKCTRKDLDMAIGFWYGAGIFDIADDPANELCTDGVSEDDEQQNGKIVLKDKPENATKPEKKNTKLIRAAGLPEYTSEELADMLEKDSKSLGFVDESQRRIGKMLNTHEVSILIGLKNHLELEDSYIFVLLDYCVRIGKTSMRYVETVAFGMYDDGVTDTDALAERLAERESYGELEGRFKAMIGARGRKLTTKESRFLNRWSVEMKYDFSMIEMAYEITADSQHEYNPAYMNGILERWYAAGIMTPEQVEAERAKKKQNPDFGNSFNTDEFFEAALRRSYGE